MNVSTRVTTTKCGLSLPPLPSTRSNIDSSKKVSENIYLLFSVVGHVQTGVRRPNRCETHCSSSHVAPAGLWSKNRCSTGYLRAVSAVWHGGSWTL